VNTSGWRLALAAKEPDQAGRLARFREDHPEIDIEPAEFGAVRALIPDQDGGKYDGREVFGRSLRELMDKLHEIFPPGAEAQPGGDRPGAPDG
jgi:hypothetical protein